MFKRRNTAYNLGNFQEIETKKKRTSYFGFETLTYLCKETIKCWSVKSRKFRLGLPFSARLVCQYFFEKVFFCLMISFFHGHFENLFFCIAFYKSGQLECSSEKIIFQFLIPFLFYTLWLLEKKSICNLLFAKVFSHLLKAKTTNVQPPKDYRKLSLINRI